MRQGESQKKPGAMVREARKRLGETQAAFGATLRRGQSLISKYERGRVDPPGEVLMYCLKVLGNNDPADSPTLNLAQSVEAHLNSLSTLELRSILMGFVAQIISRPSPIPPPPKPSSGA